MDKKTDMRTVLLILLMICLAAGAFFAGRTGGCDQIQKERQELYELNRSSIEKMSIEEGKQVYVIGHRSPDSDTVCSAIAYARFLTMLGYPAEARITEEVNKETAYILKDAGMEVPEVLDDASGEDIFLVDHSEYAQAVEGLQDAHVVGILDHHGSGTVTTGHQIVYEAKPIGSTSTIIWLDYLNCGLEIDPVTAKLMLGAILSDTDNLFGSTTTEADRKAVKELAETAGVTDVNAYYRAIHSEKLSYEGLSDMEILFSDYKDYEAAGVKFGIGLTNAIDDEAAAALAQRMKEILPEGFKTRNVDYMFAAVSIRENGEKIDYIVPCDEQAEQLMKDAFPDYDEYDGTSFIFRKGLGRKTKLVPGLTDYLSAHPHE